MSINERIHSYPCLPFFNRHFIIKSEESGKLLTLLDSLLTLSIHVYSLTKNTKISSGYFHVDDPKFDLTEAVKSIEGVEISGRDEEICKIENILTQAESPSVILYGDAGVGKTSIVLQLARKINRGIAAKRLQGAKIFKFSPSDFKIGTCYVGQYEEKVQNFFDKITKKPNAIVFIDEIHAIANISAPNSAHLTDLLKPYLDSGKIRIIGCTTTKEKKLIEDDPALTRRFTFLEIKKCSLDQKIRALQAKMKFYENFHYCTFSNEAKLLLLKNFKSLEAISPTSIFTICDFLASNARNQTPQIDEALAKIEINKKQKDQSFKITTAKIYKAFGYTLSIFIFIDLFSEDKSFFSISTVLKSLGAIFFLNSARECKRIPQNNIHKLGKAIVTEAATKMAIDEKLESQPKSPSYFA